jgi:hypothetical protein
MNAQTTAALAAAATLPPAPEPVVRALLPPRRERTPPPPKPTLPGPQILSVAPRDSGADFEILPPATGRTVGGYFIKCLPIKSKATSPSTGAADITTVTGERLCPELAALQAPTRPSQARLGRTLTHGGRRLAASDPPQAANKIIKKNLSVHSVNPIATRCDSSN